MLNWNFVIAAQYHKNVAMHDVGDYRFRKIILFYWNKMLKRKLFMTLLASFTCNLRPRSGLVGPVSV